MRINIKSVQFGYILYVGCMLCCYFAELWVFFSLLAALFAGHLIAKAWNFSCDSFEAIIKEYRQVNDDRNIRWRANDITDTVDLSMTYSIIITLMLKLLFWLIVAQFKIFNDWTVLSYVMLVLTIIILWLHYVIFNREIKYGIRVLKWYFNKKE